MKKLLYIALFCFLSVPFIANAQVKEKIEEAYTLYKTGQFDEAASAIDKVTESDKGRNNKIAWHIRGFIYKDLYLDNRKTDKGVDARDQAITSFKESMKLDDDGALDEQNRKALKVLAVSFFNDASEIIEKRDPDNIENANGNYSRYRSLTLFLFPDSVMKEKDIEFYLAMSTAHRKIYESNRDKYEAHWQISNDYILKVLELDPKNWPALYSLSVSHYNKGAYNLERLPDVTSIPDIYEIQAESMRSIEIALPYMMKAYEVNPEKIESVKGIRVITFNLNQQEESEQFRLREKELEGQRK